jgi:hypothetical protein
VKGSKKIINSLIILFLFSNSIVTVLSLSSLNSLGHPNYYDLPGHIFNIFKEEDFLTGQMDDLVLNNDGVLPKLRLVVDDWTCSIPQNLPEPVSRFYSAMAPIHTTDKVLMFGGRDYFEHQLYELNDTWIYDHSEKDWTKLNIIGDVPKPRYGHDLAPIWGTDKVLLWGGGYTFNQSTNLYYNDTWIFDYSNQTWTKQNPSRSPLPRSSYALEPFFGTDNVLLYGGHPEEPDETPYSEMDQTWIYDYSANTWNLTTPSKPPGAMNDHAMAAIYGTDMVMVFTGIGPWTYDTWVYDLSDGEWFKREQTEKPTSRRSSDMVTIYDSDKVLLFGGYSGYEYKDDTWIYDYSENSWTLLKPGSKPTRRDRHMLSMIYGQEDVIVYKGSNQEGNDYYLDRQVWSYNLSGKPAIYGEFISKIYAIGDDVEYSNITWVEEVPENTDIKIYFRTNHNRTMLEKTAFIGPDGSSDSCYQEPGDDTWAGHDGDGFFQLKFVLTSDIIGISPEIEDIGICYNHQPMLFDPDYQPYYNNGIQKMNFSISFDDRDYDDAQYVNLIIDNQTYPTEFVYGYRYHSDGDRYNVTITLEPSEYYYYFSCSDGLSKFETAPYLCVVPNPISEIKITPERSFINESNKVYFTATGIDYDGKSIEIDPIWSTSGQDWRSLVDNVEDYIWFGKEGEYLVTADYFGLTGTANVFVYDNLNESTDRDSDMVQDIWEIKYGLDPNDPSDSEIDLDADGLSNLQEFLHNTSPKSSDTDGDGYSDGFEVEAGSDPLNNDDHPYKPVISNEEDPNDNWWLILIIIIITLVVFITFAVYNKMRVKNGVYDHQSWTSEQYTYSDDKTSPQITSYNVQYQSQGDYRSQRVCIYCGGNVQFVKNYNKYYCYNCRRYLP